MGRNKLELESNTTSRLDEKKRQRIMTMCSQIWSDEDLGSYNFGYNSQFEDYLNPKKATITEITDMDLFEDDLQDMDLDVDVLGKAFENVIDDWKIKMEVIIGDGLKKLRKSQKDRKLMMKYLPGNKKVQAAKEDIVKDWKSWPPRKPKKLKESPKCQPRKISIGTRRKSS